MKNVNDHKPKYRHEFKYLISETEIKLCEQRINKLISLDSHVGPSGVYNISSLYFDDIYDSCLQENEDGTDPREKFRIRIYNHDVSRISLECKRKERGKTLKTSCALTYEQAETLVSGNYIRDVDSQPPLLAKLTEKMMTSFLRPKVIVEYDRIPYVSKFGNVRVTFDTNLSSSNDVANFLGTVTKKRPVMPRGIHLLEVKYDEYLPDLIKYSLQIDNLNLTAYSKYYLCRKYEIK